MVATCIGPLFLFLEPGCAELFYSSRIEDHCYGFDLHTSMTPAIHDSVCPEYLPLLHVTGKEIWGNLTSSFGVTFRSGVINILSISFLYMPLGKRLGGVSHPVLA